MKSFSSFWTHHSGEENVLEAETVQGEKLTSQELEQRNQGSVQGETRSPFCYQNVDHGQNQTIVLGWKCSQEEHRCDVGRIFLGKSSRSCVCATSIIQLHGPMIISPLTRFYVMSVVQFFSSSPDGGSQSIRLQCIPNRGISPIIFVASWPRSASSWSIPSPTKWWVIRPRLLVDKASTLMVNHILNHDLWLICYTKFKWFLYRIYRWSWVLFIIL